MPTYKEKLPDPRWQRKRLEVMDRDNFSCVRCFASDKSLQVHHKKYIKGREPWEYDHSELETLCYRCHEKEHNIPAKDSYERNVQTLVGKVVEQPEIIQALDLQIDNLMQGLKTQKDEAITEDIMKNVMFLQSKKKELLSYK